MSFLLLVIIGVLLWTKKKKRKNPQHKVCHLYSSSSSQGLHHTPCCSLIDCGPPSDTITHSAEAIVHFFHGEPNNMSWPKFLLSFFNYYLNLNLPSLWLRFLRVNTLSSSLPLRKQADIRGMHQRSGQNKVRCAACRLFDPGRAVGRGSNELECILEGIRD